MIVGKAEKGDKARKVSPGERAARFNQKPMTVWLTGDTQLDTAYRLDRSLFDLGYASAVLDDDFLGGQAALVARQLNEAGLICICALENVQPEVSEGSLVLNTDNLAVEDLVKLLHSYSQPKPDQESFDFEI
jgi:bifunctional enzyme CysN/CysC